MATIFRRIGGRVVPIITAALKKSNMNTPAIRSELAKKIMLARKGKGTIGGQGAEVVSTLTPKVKKSLFIQVPRKGSVGYVGVMTDGRTGVKRQQFVRSEGKNLFSNMFTKKTKGKIK